MDHGDRRTGSDAGGGARHPGERTGHAHQHRQSHRAEFRAAPANEQHAAGGEPRGSLVARARGLPRAPSRGAPSRQERGGEVMAGRTAHLMVSIALVTAAASGCGTSAPSRFYTLDATAVSDGTAPVHYPLMVGTVAVPPAFAPPRVLVQ